MAEKDNLEKEEILKDQTTATEHVEQASMEQDQETDDQKLVKENQELKEKYLRLYSEFDNYRRRTAKERLELIKTASEDVLKDLITVVDDFERAFKAEESKGHEANDQEGNRLIYQKLVKIMESKGLKPMNDLHGKPFDAETQEAITQIPAPTEDLKGKVVDVVEKGYTLGDKVVRYAKVVIGA